MFGAKSRKIRELENELEEYDLLIEEYKTENQKFADFYIKVLDGLEVGVPFKVVATEHEHEIENSYLSTYDERFQIWRHLVKAEKPTRKTTAQSAKKVTR